MSVVCVRACVRVCLFYQSDNVFSMFSVVKLILFLFPLWPPGPTLKWNFTLQNMFEGKCGKFMKFNIEFLCRRGIEIAKAVMKSPPHALLEMFKTSCASQVLAPRQTNINT